MAVKRYVIALGFFDGVHLGHQTLLYACRRMAEQAGAGAAAITFEQHPQSLFTCQPPLLVNTTADRSSLLQQYGVETVLTYPVTERVMGIPWQDFLMELYRDHSAVGFICGYDFRFGHNGEGNAEKIRLFCQEFGLLFMAIPEQKLDGIRVSSTHIRQLIEAGEMEQAVRFLGHPHSLTGRVVSGRQLGRTIGIPTANLELPEGVIVPKFGVYACKAKTPKGEYLAVTNVGSRPTVGGHHVTVEPWLLDFDGDLYGKELKLEFYAFLRPEQKFNSLEALRSEIRKNAEQTREFFEKN